MRRLMAYITALILAVSCRTELEQDGMAVGSSLEGAPVTITFCVPDIPVLPATKTLETGDGDISGTPYLDPNKVYLVVCGGSQSIKYIRRAKLMDTLPNQEVPQDKYPLSEGDRKVTLYKFEVQLELSDFDRTIHFLGNVDENQLITGSYSYNCLPNLLSFNNKQAYWQKLYVPHIKAKLNSETNKPIIEDGRYVPDDETRGFFQYIPLIRNFAKIQVTNAADNFQLHSYSVIYYPEEGSVTPYRSNESVKENRFDFNPSSGYLLSGYERSTFDELDIDINYLGNMPSGIALNDVIPPASEFEDPSTSGGRVLLYNENDTESGLYMYERGIPNDKIGPTFIILCGKFDKDDKWYYYRLDLMESKVEGNQTVSKYYPIYRNFRYNIRLHRISSEGVLTPELAAVSSGAEDISADVSMRHLSDISNGTTRLVVDPFMTRTYTGPSDDGYYELYARFFNDVYSDVPNIETAAVRVELESMTDGSDDILILYDGNGKRVPSRGFFFPEAATVGGVEGIRTIRFNTVEPLSETKTQKIKIIGHKPGNHQDLRLYREVEITLQKKQPLKVTCTNPVQTFSNVSVTVDITIPSELPESMFPLEFIVEPEAGTLTPDASKDVNMPVASGRSIATSDAAFTERPAFYYIRTLTWEEFSDLPVSEDQRTFNCYFKTNREFNATTIWVYNEYFSKGSTSFENKMPLTMTCTNPVLAAADTPVILALTIHSKLPQDMFPLEFIVEPESMTNLTPDTSKGIDLPVVAGPSIATNVTTFKDTYVYQYIRTLTWDEYSSLPVSGNQRTFYCYFMSTKAQSATTIWAYHKNFYKANVSFQNASVIPDNHFWVSAIEDCTVKLNYNGVQYKIDNGIWLDYNQNSDIPLTAGQKVSFKGGSASKKKTWTVESAFKCTGGQFKVGGNFASLMVGDDYPTAGAGKTGDKFINFFKGHTNLIDAYDLELPMLSPTTNAYKSMFDSCTNLVSGPEILPATTLGETCYRNMFYNCSSLEYAPALPATSLAKGVYQRIFWGCAKLDKITMLGKNWREDVFKSDGTTWCTGVAAEGEIWLDASLENAANWSTTWGAILPANWTIHWVE